MFVVAVTLIAKPDKAEAFRARVRRQAAESLDREPGCHRFDVCADPPSRPTSKRRISRASTAMLHL